MQGISEKIYKKPVKNSCLQRLRKRSTVEMEWRKVFGKQIYLSLISGEFGLCLSGLRPGSVARDYSWPSSGDSMCSWIELGLTPCNSSTLCLVRSFWIHLSLWDAGIGPHLEMLRGYFCLFTEDYRQCFRDCIGWQDSNLGLTHERQMTHLLYYLSFQPHVPLIFTE